MQKSISISFIFYLLLTSLSSCISSYHTTNLHRAQKGLQISYNTSVSYNNKDYPIQGLIKTNQNNIFFTNGYSKNLGIEIFRLLVIDDSLWFVNRLQKNYFVGSVNDFRLIKGNNLNAFILNDLILGKKCNILEFKDEFKVDSVKNDIHNFEIIYSNGCNDFFVKQKIANNKVEQTEFGTHGFINRINYSLYDYKFNVFNNLNFSFNTATNNFNAVVHFNEIEKIKLKQLYFNIPKNYKAY